MKTLRLVVAFVAGIALAAFAVLNWIDVSVRLGLGTPVVLPLPLLIAAAVLLGAVPVWVWASAGHWSLRRRLNRAERALGVAHDAVSGTSADMRPAPTYPEA